MRIISFVLLALAGVIVSRGGGGGKGGAGGKGGNGGKGGKDVPKGTATQCHKQACKCVASSADISPAPKCDSKVDKCRVQFGNCALVNGYCIPTPDSKDLLKCIAKR